MYTGNCSHRRRIGNTILCVETYERDHSLYDKEDEKIRYDDLYIYTCSYKKYNNM